MTVQQKLYRAYPQPANLLTKRLHLRNKWLVPDRPYIEHLVVTTTITLLFLILTHTHLYLPKLLYLFTYPILFH